MDLADINRFMPLREAAGIVGRRFHETWDDADPDVLDTADADAEARDRAASVQRLLTEYVADGHVTAYQDGPVDGSGRAVIDIPPDWREAASFKLCIRTSRFCVFTDLWEPVYIERRGLLEYLPKVAGERNAGRYHAKDVVHAAWKLALADADGLTKAELTRRVVDWLAGRNLYPDPTTLDDITGEVVAFLRENKTKPRVCESLPSCDPPPNPA